MPSPPCSLVAGKHSPKNTREAQPFLVRRHAALLPFLCSSGLLLLLSVSHHVLASLEVFPLVNFVFDLQERPNPMFFFATGRIGANCLRKDHCVDLISTPQALSSSISLSGEPSTSPTPPPPRLTVTAHLELPRASLSLQVNSLNPLMLVLPFPGSMRHRVFFLLYAFSI